MKSKKYIWPLFFVLLMLIGCSEKLDEKEHSFEGQGTSYTIQLPSKNWKKENEAEDVISKKYGAKTLFSAADAKSNSYMFVSATPVYEVNYQNFAKETRKKLSQRYGYKQEKDIYMKELKIDGHNAVKYTLATSFEQKDVWAHLYYIWEDHEFLQVVYYSADDNGYKKRSLLIDDSIESLKKTDFDAKKEKK